METSNRMIEMLELQLSEVEMLECMFPNPGEFELDDRITLSELKEFVNGNIEYDHLTARIGFTIKLDIDGSEKRCIEVVCHLPHEYPDILPELFLRAPFISRSDHRKLSDDLLAYMAQLDRGEICIGSAIEWIKDNIQLYLKDTASQLKLEVSKRIHEETVFSRMWIYSHHLYSKIKRKDILEFSQELNLTGFSMPGKPGLIVIEGYRCDVEEFWQRVRKMQWKRLVMKEKEECQLENQVIDFYRKFQNFEEKHFDPRPGKGRGAHMDLGLLYKFLEEKNCTNIFHLFFGVDGKPTQVLEKD